MASQLSPKFESEHKIWTEQTNPSNDLEHLLSPSALNHKYTELQEIIRSELMVSEESTPRSEVTDYNKMVQLLHEEAFKDAQLSK